MEIKEHYMHRCIELASLGLGRVQPNPLVGAMVVHNEKIIGEGWHRRYGEAHAEINAIAAVADPEKLKESTLYVNLEPCSHYGRTPPCAEAIIQHRIPRVVIGNQDPYEKVNGGGIKKLQEAGVEIITKVLEDECRELNKRFFTYHIKKRPYIILKWAQTADGYIDIDRSSSEEITSYWITNTELRTIVHKWRSEEDAILVGYNTMRNDHPQLTTRFFPGKSPIPFVMKRNHEKGKVENNFTFLPDNIDDTLSILYEKRIESVIVEGGAKTISMFLENNTWDEARILVGNQKWGKGTPAPICPGIYEREEVILNNRILYVRRYL